MGMEISGNNSRPPQGTVETGKSQATATQGSGARGGASAKASGGGSDQVRLSNQAAQLQALEAEIANLPIADTQRVQEVQHTIATGAFQIEPAQVADKMLTFEAGLGDG